MHKIVFFAIAVFACFTGFSQKYNIDSALNALNKQKDSTLRALKTQRDSSHTALMHADSAKADKEFNERINWEKVKSIALYPVIKDSENSGVVPVKDPTEVPDPNMEYKLLFEITALNPDSAAKDINSSLAEIGRVINLHVASGIPIKKIIPVITVHAAALKAISNNEYYKKQFKMDNPNIKIINDLVKLGAKFIACGQAMTFFEVKKEDLLPEIKISFTSQTVISSYQLKGYVLYRL